jgi:hypothetical protein
MMGLLLGVQERLSFWMLWERGIFKATFYVTGSRTNARPDIVKQEHDAGHEIAVYHH